MPLLSQRVLLSLLWIRFLFLFGGGGTASRLLVSLSVTLFLGTGGQLSLRDDRDEFVPYGTRDASKRGAHARITRRHDGVIFGHIFALLRRLVNIPGPLYN